EGVPGGERAGDAVEAAVTDVGAAVAVHVGELERRAVVVDAPVAEPHVGRPEAVTIALRARDAARGESAGVGATVAVDIGEEHIGSVECALPPRRKVAPAAR